MSNFNYIIDPKTKEKKSLFGQEGGRILSKYVNIYKKIRKKPKETFKEPIKKQDVEEWDVLH